MARELKLRTVLSRDLEDYKPASCELALLRRAGDEVAQVLNHDRPEQPVENHVPIRRRAGKLQARSSPVAIRWAACTSRPEQCAARCRVSAPRAHFPGTFIVEAIIPTRSDERPCLPNAGRAPEETSAM